MKSKEYDVVILGAGPAGLSAGIYTARDMLKTLIIGKMLKSTATYAHILENYPGYKGSGLDLLKIMKKQAESFGVEFSEDESKCIEKDKEGFIVSLSKEKIKAKAIILAMGTKRRKLDIPGEERFIGRGVSYCATCDAPLFKNKEIAIIGGSDACAMSVLILEKYAKKVSLIYRREKLRMERISQEKINKLRKVEKIFNAVPIEIKGKDFVESLILKENGKTKELKVDGVFIEIGGIPNSKLAKKLGIKLDKEGYIITENLMKTNINGVFAIGDIVSGSFKQVAVAVGHGATAGKSACDYINTLYGK